jgi:hypothetical protein
MLPFYIHVVNADTHFVKARKATENGKTWKISFQVSHENDDNDDDMMEKFDFQVT